MKLPIAMLFLAIVVFFIGFFFGHVLVWILFHPINFLFNLFRDIYYYIFYQEYKIWKNNGYTICYFGSFGSGKSLNLSKYIRSTLKRYNGKCYRDRSTKKKVKQIFVIHSNFKLFEIPTVPINALNDITDTLEAFREDKQEDVRICHIFAIDEINNILNCKDYKDNTNPYILRGIMQVRKGNIQLCLSGQLPMQIDKSFRDIVDDWRECHKFWRISWYRRLSGDKVRNTEDISTIKSRGRFSWFVLDNDYNSFDTFESIKELQKGIKERRFISAKDIAQDSIVYANINEKKKHRIFK